MSFTRSPSTAVIACQAWISVAAREGEGTPVRSTAAATRTLRAERVMESLPEVCEFGGHYSTRRRRADDTGATRRLRPELLRALDMRPVRVELGVEPSGRPAENLRHTSADRFRTILPLAAAGADTGSSQQHVLERDRHLVLHRAVQLGDHVGVRGTERLGAGRHLAGEIDHAAPAATVRGHQRLQRLRAEPGGGRLAGDIEPRPRLDVGHLVVSAVEREPIAASGAGTAER